MFRDVLFQDAEWILPHAAPFRWHEITELSHYLLSFSRSLILAKAVLRALSLNTGNSTGHWFSFRIHSVKAVGHEILALL